MPRRPPARPRSHFRPKLPKNGSPGLLPAAIVTMYLCLGQAYFATKLLQKRAFSPRADAGGG
jgi:hypothetical protein